MHVVKIPNRISITHSAVINGITIMSSKERGSAPFDFIFGFGFKKEHGARRHLVLLTAWCSINGGRCAFRRMGLIIFNVKFQEPCTHTHTAVSIGL